MKSKRILSVLLALVMILSLCACGIAPQTAKAETPEAPAAAETSAQADAAAPAAEAPAAPQTELSDIDAQLVLISQQAGKLLQPTGELPWYYTVTDLDHNGRLEFIAASQHPSDRSTNLKLWEVSNDRSALTECGVKKDEDESFPDLMTDSTDTFHVAADDSWNYMFYDNILVSDQEIYTIKSSFKLKDGVISYEAYAQEHTLVKNGMRYISYTNPNGADISQADYSAAGVNAFSGAERSNTSFEWLVAEDAKDLAKLTDCMMVFVGMKKAPETFPVPKPAALSAPLATATPAPTLTPVITPAPTPVPVPTYLTITKNPTNENKRSGQTAQFVACANAFDSLNWVLVSPYGQEYTPAQFARMYADAPVYGEYSTTLSISNVAEDMSGWGAYCTFFYKGQTARTSTAYLYVSPTPRPAPTPQPQEGGVYYGSVSDWNYSTVSVNLDGSTIVALPWDICNLSGEIYYGAPATAYWQGTTTKGLNFTYCLIEGSQPGPDPTPGSMSGYAHEGGGGFAIDLANGSQVFVDSWNCKVEGQFYDGCSAIVYYYGSPTSDNIYLAEIYGNMGLIVPTEEDQGGWAGAHYYDNMPEEDQGGWAGSHYYDSMPEPDYVYIDSDGLQVTTWSDGSQTFMGEDGSFFHFETDGSWAYYDPETDEISGGMIYD